MNEHQRELIIDPIDESLVKAQAALQVAGDNLRDAVNAVSNAEVLLLLPVISQTNDLRDRVMRILSAHRDDRPKA